MPKELVSSYPGRRYFERGANLLKESIENQRISFGRFTNEGKSASEWKVEFGYH